MDGPDADLKCAAFIRNIQGIENVNRESEAIRSFIDDKDGRVRLNNLKKKIEEKLSGQNNVQIFQVFILT